MTDNEIRVAIAEACGFKTMPASPDLMWNEKENRAVIKPGTKVEAARLRMKMEYIPGKQALPDYLNSLDAMHEAEKVLFPVEVSQLYEPDLWKEYRMTLEQLCMGHAGGAIRAPAKQRAIAVLHTIGKWKD